MLVRSLNEGKNCNIFLASRLPPDPPPSNCIRSKPKLFAKTSLYSDSSQYARFCESLINYFWNRPWYSDESVWRLHYIPIWAAWVIFILSKNKGFQSEALLKMPCSSSSLKEIGQKLETKSWSYHWLKIITGDWIEQIWRYRTTIL